MASNFNVQVHAYHADIGIYHSKPRAKVQDEWVGAQFQNGAVESIIMSVFQSAWQSCYMHKEDDQL